jgi:uncharacterized protein
MPTIWVLKSFRAGDNAQALAIAQRVGGTVVEKQMTFNKSAMLPNLITGASVRMLTNEARGHLQQPWPDLVIATGRRTASVALWIKEQSSGKTRLVQLGRPRLPLHLFDLVITTPQYGLPPAENVIQLPLPFVPERKVPNQDQAQFLAQWNSLPKPWIVAVVGGQKFPLRLGGPQLSAFGYAVNQLAVRMRAGVIVLASPRSPNDATAKVGEQISQPKWIPLPEQPNAYGAALALGDAFCVTSDSVSMVAEMLATGKPVHVQELPQSSLMPHWQATRGITATLARRGLLSPPRNVADMMRKLMDDKTLGDLTKATEPSARVSMAPQYDAAMERIRSLLRL